MEVGVQMHLTDQSRPHEAHQQQQGQSQVYNHSVMGSNEEGHVVDPLDVHHAMHIEQSNTNNNNNNNVNGGPDTWL
jgi:hypothetical protein